MKLFIVSGKKSPHWSHMRAYNENCWFMLTYIPCYIGSEERNSRLQMFFKISILKKFANFTGKTPVLESLFNNFVGLQACNFIKRDSTAGVLLWNLQKLKDTFSYRATLVAVFLTRFSQERNYSKTRLNKKTLNFSRYSLSYLLSLFFHYDMWDVALHDKISW